MKVEKCIGVHPWLFTGLSLLPGCLLIAVLACLMIFGKRVDTSPSAIPDWASFSAFGALPVLVSIIGFALAYFLSLLLEKSRWLAGRQLVHVYMFLFALIWNVVFGYLSFFVFAMGFGDGPAATSMEEFCHRFFGIVCIGLPEATLISLLVCSVVTAVIAAVSEAIVLCMTKITQ